MLHAAAASNFFGGFASAGGGALGIDVLPVDKVTGRASNPARDSSLQVLRTSGPQPPPLPTLPLRCLCQCCSSLLVHLGDDDNAAAAGLGAGLCWPDPERRAAVRRICVDDCALSLHGLSDCGLLG